MASEVIRKCGYCKNFESCRGTSADDTPELMRCIAFEFDPEKTSTNEENDMSALPPKAPAAPAAPTAAPSAPAAPAAPAAPQAPAAPAAPSMPVMGSEDAGPGFVGGTVPPAPSAPAAPAAPAAPSAPAAPTPAAMPEPQPQVFSTGNEELDELLNKDASKMAAKERKEYITTLNGTLRAWEGWASDPNLPPADKEMGDRVVAAIKASIEQAEATKVKRTPKAPSATPPAADPTLAEPQEPAAPAEPAAPSVPEQAAPAAPAAPVQEAPAPKQTAEVPASVNAEPTDADSIISNLVVMQGQLINTIKARRATENTEPYLEAYSDISDAIVSLLRAGH